MNHSVEKLLKMNEHHSGQYADLGVERQIYRAQHPTEIGVMKCMDGRLHLPVMTETALGIIQPWRNLGGKFNLGWPHFQDTVVEWADYAFNRGRHCVVFATYHFARGFEGENAEKVLHRGCKGYGYDTELAKKESLELKEQFDRVFNNDGLYAIHAGIETDLEALILHGDNGETVDLANVTATSDAEIEGMLRKLFTKIPSVVISDLIPVIAGNIRHIEKIRAAKRPTIDTEHKEWVLALGRGFDWLHEINTALIVGPFDPDLEGAVATAAGLLKGNINDGRIKAEDGLVLLVSAPYRDSAGYKKRKAEEKAKYLSSLAYKVISEKVPEIIPHLSVVTATCDMNTRKLNLLN